MNAEHLSSPFRRIRTYAFKGRSCMLYAHSHKSAPSRKSIADGTAKGIRGRVGRRQNILQKGVFGKPKAPFFVKLPELHRREAATETCRGKRWRSDCRIGQTIVKRGLTVVKRSLMLKKPPLTSSRYGPDVTNSRFAQLATRWLSGREPGSSVSSPSSPYATERGSSFFRSLLLQAF